MGSATAPTRRPEVRLRMLTPDDSTWLTRIDREGSFEFLEPKEWDERVLAEQLDAGEWATDDQVGWAVVVDGEPSGVAFARKLTTSDGILEIRLARGVRGRGVGREVLRRLADHHFTSSPQLRRLVGTAHEHNVPMQRAFNAAGFRMEARFRDAVPLAGGGYASAWGYALTRTDWESGAHRRRDESYDLHGLSFAVEEAGTDDAVGELTLYKFLQEGRRVIARYGDGEVLDGELAGIVAGDLLRHRFVHDSPEGRTVAGSGRMRVQRRGDGRLELIDEWSSDAGDAGRRVLVERR